jgi:hypothetical protein
MPNSEAMDKRINELRGRLLEDMSPGELLQMQLRVDTLMRLAMMDAGHDHDTVGGVGHHDHTALADLSWRLEAPRQIRDIEKK